jgi:ferrous iron transport protein B
MNNIEEILLVGNPNAGKSTLFNQLTGLKQKVGNFPGITVEKSFAQFKSKQFQTRLVDLPGVYSLIPQQQSSEDERVTLNYLMASKNSVVINVVDATALERHLYLSIQLRELGIPMVLLLNKWDLAQQAAIEIDIHALSSALNCPVLVCNANDKISADFFDQAISQILENPPQPLSITYDNEVEAKLSDSSNRFQTLLTLLAESEANASIDYELLIASARYQYCHSVVEQAMPTQTVNFGWSEKLDAWLLKPWVAIPAFLFSMYLMFMFSINIGGAFIDFFDIAVGALLVDGLANVLTQWEFPQWLIVLLTDGIGTGVQTVSTFIPLIFCLYLFLTFLEQSGYLARAAVVTDRIMQKVGLPGSAFVPLMMGFGCTVPAVMATRTLKQKRERILSSAMSHFMVCGARLPVFALFAAAFFSENALKIVFLLYLLGIFAAIFTGVIFRKTLLAGESSPFIIELPQYQLPKLTDLVTRAIQRLKGFVFGAGKTIVIVVTILGMVNSVGKDGSFGHAGTESSMLSIVSQKLTPIFHPMGIEDNNWQATVGIFTGLFAKEVLVGTLNSLYEKAPTDEEFSLADKLNEAVASIGEHFIELKDRALDPLGIGATNATNVQEAASAQEVSIATLNRMVEHFDGKVGAFAYLLFILLYAPCASALGAIAREFNGRWALFIAIWSTLLAYTVATIYYQLATIESIRSINSVIMLAVVFVFLLFVQLMKHPLLIHWLSGGQSYAKAHPKATCH